MNTRYGRAICYSGYREGQSPQDHKYPKYEEVLEDLLLLEKDYDYIRMYDPGNHTKMVMDIIRTHNIKLQVMVGINLLGEISNPNCAWGGTYSQPQLAKHIEHNEEQLRSLIELANQYPDIIYAVAAGNEAVPEWNENLVSPQRVLYFVNQLKKYTKQLVTYCDNNHYWTTILSDVARAVDFISIHTYPVWVGKSVDEAIHQSIRDYDQIKHFYPNKPCIITETGWPTTSQGFQIRPENASEDFQVRFVNELKKWSEKNKILIYFFEAFDEPWKGSPEPNEPEKHWGFYYVNRRPKKIQA